MNKKTATIIIILISLIILTLVIRFKTGSSKTIEVAVITYVTHPVLNNIKNSFEQELKELMNEKDIDYRLVEFNAQGVDDNLHSISKQVLSTSPFLVLTISTPVSQFLMRQADNEQKIVYSFVTNPDDLGEDLTRTNSTGISDAVNYTENIELINYILGDSITIGMLYNPSEPNSVYGINKVKQIISQSPSKLITATVTKESEIPTSINQILNKVDVIYVGGDNTVVGNITSVISRAHQNNIPVFASDEGSVKSGALCGVSVDYNELGRETAVIVYRIINGENPKNIKRKKLEGKKLLINRKAYDQLKIEFPNEVTNRAEFVD